MSAKLYNGIRFKSRNMADILQQLVSLRKDIVKYANNLLDVEEIKFFIIINKLNDANCHEIFRKIIDSLNSTNRTILSIRFNFSIALIPEKNGYVYGYYFVDYEEYFDLIKPFVEDYHYQNQCDKPDNISNREWNNRRKKWDKLLGYDTFSQRAFTFSMVDSNDLDIFSTLKKIEKAIDEIKYENNNKNILSCQK